nr:hypothetical protein [uncultured Rhodopila sp.]
MAGMSAKPLFQAIFEHDLHLSLRDRKQLAVQIIVARTLQIPVPSANSRLHRNLAKIVTKIRDLARPELDQDEVSLADFLANLASQLPRFVKTRRFPKGAEERHHIARFMLEARFLKHTPAPLPHNEIHEVRWLGEMFVWLVAIAEKAYAPALQGNGNGGLALRLRTLPQTASEIKGETVFRSVNDANTARAADVSIKLPLQHFSDDHFCQLPSIMFHEVFVHGPQAWETVGCRKVVGELCALREGFVDAAAHAALVAELENASVPRLLRPFHVEVRSGIGEAHRQRSEAALVPETDDNAHIHQKMVRKFRKRGRTTFEDLAAKSPCAMQLALCLNLLELQDEDGCRLVERLRHAIDRPTPPTGKQIRDTNADWLDELCSAAATFDHAKVRALVARVLPGPSQGDSPQSDPARAFFD